DCSTPYLCILFSFFLLFCVRFWGKGSLLFQRNLSTKRTFPSLIGLLYLKHIDRKRFSVYTALFRLLYVFLSVSVSFFSCSILRRIFRQIVCLAFLLFSRRFIRASS